jgi:aryl-alcohol dehydrogenase-like predicted oxidoreductase
MPPPVASVFERSALEFAVPRRRAGEDPMEYRTISDVAVPASRVGLGTWAMGGVQWGGADDDESVRTIHAALDQGMTLIDTAPAYGFGHSEEVVGRAIAEQGGRGRLVLATKVGLERKGDGVVRNATRGQIFREVEDSLAVRLLDRFARERYAKGVLPLGVRWVLEQPGVTVALWGFRHPSELEPLKDVFGWSLDADAQLYIREVISESVPKPVGPEFMAPPEAAGPPHAST